MSLLIHRMLGHYLMDEAGADGGDGGGGAAPAAEAPAASEAPAAAAPAAEAAPAESILAPAEKQAPVTPEGEAVEYTDFTIPDGVELNPEVLADFKAIAKELGIPQEKAQQLVDLQVQMENNRVAAIEQAIVDQSKQWADAVKADKDIGGEKFEKTKEVAIKAVERFGSPELRNLLIDSGLGNHPEMVKLFHRIGQSISEDGLVLPGTQSNTTTNQRTADVLFGDILQN